MLVKFPDSANAKTRELVLYVAEKLKAEPSYGATLLNKALYFIDNLNYLRNKEPVSNLKYIKQDFGPTPMPSQFLALKESLVENKEIVEVKTNFWGRVQKKCIPQRPPNMDLFDKEEILLIDSVLLNIANHTATSISEVSHAFLAWTLANNMDELPYYTFVLTSRPPTEQDIAWAKNEIAKYTN